MKNIHLSTVIRLALTHVLSLVGAFNLEYRVPVLKEGTAGSYFGFSVAEHKIFQDERGDASSWLLVGAPLGQNLQPNTSNSGALFKCPLTPQTNDCVQVITDGRRDETGGYENTIDSDELRGPHREEIKDGQWLGVSVRSQGANDGKVSVCAHRYIRKSGESLFGQGLCYTLKNDLEFDTEWEPCKGRSTQKEHEEFGYCQVGTSSSYLSDGTLILGTPGPHTWRGTLFVMDTQEDYIQRDHLAYYGALVKDAAPVDKYSYLGMSVAGGYFFGPEMSFVAGAPRSNGTGQIVLFSKIKTEKIMTVPMIIDGEQFASNFGYEVATADLNGDGKTDIIVAAPFYFDRTNGGSVYVYINDNFSFHSKYNIKLTGKIESRFGFAISNAGDLNKDGCDDLAIGSPYEGSGAVYIYLGNKLTGLDREPKQVIKSEMLPRPIRTFGYSLSGGMDLDNNGYPDLLVGAYEQDAVVLLRGRPIIDIKINVNMEKLKKIDPTKNGCFDDRNSNYTCFSFEICCGIEAFVNSSRETLFLNYAIEAETFMGLKKFSRVFFGSPDGSKLNTLKTTINMPRGVKTHCQNHIVYMKENTRDKQSPIKFQANYSLVQEEPIWTTKGDLISVDRWPILNATHAVKEFEAMLLRDCGDDDICDSDLVIKTTSNLPKDGDKYVLSLGKIKEVKIIVYVENMGEPAYDPQLFIAHHKNLKYIAANIEDESNRCYLHNNTMIACTLKNPLKTIMNNGSTAIILRFDPQSLEDNENSFNFEIWANTTSRDNKKKSTILNVSVIKNVELSIKGIARPEQVFYGGDIKGESAMKYFDDVGTRIVHTYQVINEGNWRVNAIRVVINWPYQIANNKKQGKWLLYLESEPTVETTAVTTKITEHGKCSVDYVNPLNLTLRDKEPIYFKDIESNKIRRKRDSEMIVKSEAQVDIDGNRRQVVNMNCKLGTAKCINIICAIYTLPPNQQATIKVTARLWNSSLVEDYPNVQYISAVSQAELQLVAHHIHQENTDDDKTTAQTKAFPDLIIRDKPNYMWWIILAICLGILLLITLILLLWKLGFFKRRRPDMTLSGNIEKPENVPILNKHNT